MRMGLLLAAMTLAAGTAGHAAEFRAASSGQLYTCAHGPITRISVPVAPPAHCCDGKLQCPQFLATTTVVAPKRSSRL
jgi:hypothetical protein